MVRESIDEISFLNEYAKRLSRLERKGIPFLEIGSFMGIDQEKGGRAVAMLRKRGLVDYGVGNAIFITNAGHELIQHNYGPKIDYDRLVIALEAVSESMTDLTDVIQPLIEDIRAGKNDDGTTRMKLWDVVDRILNSTATATTIVANLRSIFGSV